MKREEIVELVKLEVAKQLAAPRANAKPVDGDPHSPAPPPPPPTK